MPKHNFNFYFEANIKHPIWFRLLKIRSEVERFIQFYKQPIHHLDSEGYFEWSGDPTPYEEVHDMVVQHLIRNQLECCNQGAQKFRSVGSKIESTLLSKLDDSS